jgi:integrase
MATVNFLYRSEKQNATLSLRLLFRYNGKDLSFGGKTKLEVSKEYWTRQHTQKRPKDIDISNKQTEVNNELNKLENFILKAFNRENPNAINKDWLEKKIYNYYNPEQEKSIPKNVIDYAEYYIEYRKHELTPDLIKKIRVTKHKLERFESFSKKQVLITDVNENFKNEFVDYCKLQLYAQNTIERDLAGIKTLCKHARYLGLDTSHQLDGLKTETLKVDNIYLTFDELDKIENENYNESLNNAKDWLIISCYTGQRISDFMRFNENQIRVQDETNLLEFTQKKTKKIMTIPIHPKVLEILKKRDGKFPYPISDQKYNDYIKEVCKIAGLTDKVKGSKKTETEPESKVFRKESGTFEKWELVTSHIGRRSFATNFYGTVPTNLLIGATGHSTEKMFLNYIGKSNKDLAMELNNYFK